MADEWISDEDVDIYVPPPPPKFRLPTVIDDGITLTVDVPSNRVGRIIGCGGVTIKQIQKDSGSRIKVLDADDFGLTKVVICGSKSARIKARDLLEPLAGLTLRPRSPTPPPPPPRPTVEPEESVNWLELSKKFEREKHERISKKHPMIKNLYREHPETAAMTLAQVTLWRHANNIKSVKRIIESDSPEPNIPNPIITFERGFCYYPEIMRDIAKQGFDVPSPIQSQAWPILLSGRDLITVAQIGTGKTHAFLLPAFIHIDSQPLPRRKRGGPNVLILAPTRDLVLQIEKEVNKYNYRDIKAVCFFGGDGRQDQASKCPRDVQIVIATPGRFNTLFESDPDFIDMEAITYLVLDEVDRMVAMGFEIEIRRSLIGIRSDHQAVLTAANWTSGVRRLATNFTKDAIRVMIGCLDLAAVHAVTQEIVFLEDNEKFDRLAAFVKTLKSDEKLVVFCAHKRTATWLSTDLSLMDMKVETIRSGLAQGDRESAIEYFNQGVVNILISTHIASRGLVVDNVTHVIIYDFPDNMEEYVHRVGRTDRTGKNGKVISYLTPQNLNKAAGLIKIMEKTCQTIPEQLMRMAKKYEAMLAEGTSNKTRRGRRKPSDRHNFT